MTGWGWEFSTRCRIEGIENTQLVYLFIFSSSFYHRSMEARSAGGRFCVVLNGHAKDLVTVCCHCSCLAHINYISETVENSQLMLLEVVESTQRSTLPFRCYYLNNFSSLNLATVQLRSVAPLAQCSGSPVVFPFVLRWEYSTILSKSIENTQLFCYLFIPSKLLQAERTRLPGLRLLPRSRGETPPMFCSTNPNTSTPPYLTVGLFPYLLRRKHLNLCIHKYRLSWW